MNLVLKKILVNLSLIAASIVFGLILLEIGIRIYYTISSNRTTIVWQDDKVVGRRIVPNQKGLFVSNTREYKTEIEINSLGFRDTEHNEKKQEDTYRIILLGDSFVENFQVPLNKTIFKTLESNLSNTLNKKVEVIALGLGDTGTAQQLLLLQEYASRFNPDLVIQLFFTANDVKNNSQKLMKDPYRPYFKLQDNKLKLLPFTTRTSNNFYNLLTKVKTNSRLIELLLNAKGAYLASHQISLPIDYEVYRTVPSVLYEDSWKITDALILETKNRVEEIGAKYMLVSLANNEQVNSQVFLSLAKRYPELSSSSFDLNAPDIHLSNLCVTNNLTCHFMLPYFKDYVNSHEGALTHFIQDGHFNDLGTKLGSDFLTQVVLNYLSSK